MIHFRNLKRNLQSFRVLRDIFSYIFKGIKISSDDIYKNTRTAFERNEF